MDPAIMMAVLAYFLAKKYDEERGQAAPGSGRPAGAPRGPLRELVSDTWRNGVNDVRGAADPMWQRRQLNRSKAAADRLRQIEENWRKAGQGAKADAARKERERLEEEVRKARGPQGTDDTRPDTPQGPAGTPPTGQGPQAPPGTVPPAAEPTAPPQGTEERKEEGPETPPPAGERTGEPEQEEPQGPDLRPGSPDYPIIVEDERKFRRPDVPEPRPEIEGEKTPEIEAPRPELGAGEAPVDAEIVEEPVVVPDTPAELVDAEADDWTPLGAGRNRREIGPTEQEAIEGAVLTAAKEGQTMTAQIDSAPQQSTGTLAAAVEGGSRAHIQFLSAFAQGLRNGLVAIETIRASMGQYGNGPEVLALAAQMQEAAQTLAIGCTDFAALLADYDRIMREAKAATNNQAAKNTTYYED